MYQARLEANDKHVLDIHNCINTVLCNVDKIEKEVHQFNQQFYMRFRRDIQTWQQ